MKETEIPPESYRFFQRKTKMSTRVYPILKTWCTEHRKHVNFK